MERRRIRVKKTSLRRELECYVIAWNTVLKKAVKTMDIITLLRNAHPSYRGDFARKLEEARYITPVEAREFIKYIY